MSKQVEAEVICPVDVYACSCIAPLKLCSPSRNPPADHWALISGLPTYVAETGLVSAKLSHQTLTFVSIRTFSHAAFLIF